jgi:ribosomal protein S27AE
MPVYAREDLASVTVSAAHGGCGSVHIRPAPGGNPVAVWKLDCAACEVHLKSDGLWASTVSEIPETPDSKLQREDWEKRGVKDRDNVLALALGRLAGVELPETLRMPELAQHATAIAGKLVCEAGHDCEAGSKFCPECGAAVRRTIPVAACPQGHQVAAGSKFCPECGNAIVVASRPAIEAPAAAVPDAAPAPANGARKKPLKDMRAADLKVLAREKGLDDTGTRADLLARLRAA